MTGWSRPSPHARRASNAAIPLLWLPMLFSLGCGASSEEPMPGIDSGTPPPPADAGSPQADAGSPALDAGEEPLDGGSATPPPTVERASTYAIVESTETYGQGLTHDDWGS